MQIQTITRDDAISLCKRQESHFFERKAKEVKSARIERAAVAFANADGGEIIIGITDAVDVSDPLLSWNGEADIEAFNPHVQALYNVVPSLPLALRFYAVEDLPGIVLSIAVDKSTKVHKTSDDTVYVRRNASSIQVDDHVKIKELEYAKGVTSFEEEKIPAIDCEAISESKTIQAFLAGFSPKTDPLDYVINEYLVDRKTWEPKYAGVLLFHDTPASALPRKCSVKVVRYETKEDDPERESLKQTITVEGPLYDLIHKSVGIVSEMLTGVNIWTLEGMKTVNYPPEALWEIVVNAIIHRDYSISDDVQIIVFDNRIEVKSPGKLPGHMTTVNVLNDRFTRNTKIVRTLARYSSPPNKDIGEGLNTAFQKMKEWRLQPPVIEEVDGSVLVTIPHATLARPEEMVLEFLAKHPQITNKQGRDLTGIKDSNHMKKVFYNLRDTDKIEPIPGLKSTASAWRLKA